MQVQATIIERVGMPMDEFIERSGVPPFEIINGEKIPLSDLFK